MLGVGQGVIETLRQAYLTPPQFVRAPAQGIEIGRGGGEGVDQGVPDILAPVTVGIDGMGEEGRGHELHLAHGARPGALHLGGGDMTFLDDAQGVEQFPAKERGPPAVVGEGGEGGRHGKTARMGAIAGLHAPQGDQHGRGDAMAAVQVGQQPAVRP